MRRLLPIAFLIAAACSAVLYVRQESDTLYFGTARPGGGVVTETEWQQFLRDVVTPRFPGFTHWDAQGEWRGTPEATHIVVIIHPETGASEAAIRQIIEEYKRRFAQEAVLQVRTDVWLPR